MNCEREERLAAEASVIRVEVPVPEPETPVADARPRFSPLFEYPRDTSGGGSGIA